jgi:hypothetical protein
MCPWSPTLFQSQDISRREDILAVLRTRLFVTAYNDNKSYSSDRTYVESGISDFMSRVLDNKSDQQLRIIQSFPNIMITPEILKMSGLSQGIAKTQTSVIYVKFATDKGGTMQLLRQSPRSRSRKFAARLETHRQMPLPPHLSSLDLGTYDKSPEPIQFTHVGRFITGAKNRRHWEEREIDQYESSKGARIWGECLVGGKVEGADMEYHVLEDHSDLIGGAWAKRMVSRSSPVW